MGTGEAWREVATAVSEVTGERVTPEALRCDLGDHRECSPDRCDIARYLHPVILLTAEEVLDRTGRRFVVMCAAEECAPTGEPRVLATVNDAWSATGVRNSHWKRVHDGYSREFGRVEMKGFVYVVDAEPSLRLR